MRPLPPFLVPQQQRYRPPHVLARAPMAVAAAFCQRGIQRAWDGTSGTEGPRTRKTPGRGGYARSGAARPTRTPLAHGQMGGTSTPSRRSISAQQRARSALGILGMTQSTALPVSGSGGVTNASGPCGLSRRQHVPMLGRSPEPSAGFAALPQPSLHPSCRSAPPALPDGDEGGT